MKSIEVSARTIEEAISDGLSKLQCSISDCRVDILHEGAKGLFGFFGSKPASVRLTLLDDGDIGAAPQPREAQKPQPAVPQPPKEKPAAFKAPASAPAAAKPSENPPQKKPAAEKPKPAQQPDKPKATQDVLERFRSAPLPGSKPAPRPQDKPEKQPVPARKPPQRPSAPPRQQRDEVYDDAHEAVSRDPVPAPENIVMHGPDTMEGRAQQFLLELTKRMGVQVQVDARVNEEGHLFATMYGDTLGILIGRRGDTLDALQYLTSLQVNRGQDEYVRVTLDTENYRAKREEALTKLAARMASRAVKTGRKVSLEPMNPYERRILHASLQGNPSVSTHSEGDEPYRHVVVVPEK